MKLLVGLGNPEGRYFRTYHNMGFWVMDTFCERFDVDFNKKKCDAVFGVVTNKDGEQVLIAKPQTYMNLSGRSLLAFKTKYKIQNKDIIVVCDDIDLPLGTLRFREKGSGGTHNGMRNIVENIGQDFARLRIGVGKPTDGTLADFVLQKIPRENLEILTNTVDEAVDLLAEKLGVVDDDV